MKDAIKNIYNYEAIRKVALDIKDVYSGFQMDEFLQSTIDETWEELALKDRVTRICTMLGTYLPANFEEAIGIIDNIVMKYGTWLDGFVVGFFPMFVEVYGQDEENWDISMNAFAKYTRYASSELAVRAFIINYEERMMEQMYTWSKDEDELVRRLSSEGCRPALPWGQAIESFKKDPQPIIRILEQLKNDPSIHVRKSVANNLNDISKTHPDVVVKIANDWYGKQEGTDWIVKHGCRTLLKKGNREILKLFGYDNIASIEILDFHVITPSIHIGEDLRFSCMLHTLEATKVRLEYAIDYVKANGKRNRKVFKVSEVSLKRNERKEYDKKQSFADVSVRKHYPGIHCITLIVNGMEHETLEFEVKE